MIRILFVIIVNITITIHYDILFWFYFNSFQALVLYVASKGFSNESYEMVTNFPRRKLSYLDFEITLKEAGLFPKETVFVQAR